MTFRYIANLTEKSLYKNKFLKLGTNSLMLIIDVVVYGIDWFQSEARTK
jgi:hypothetical protein